MASKNRTGNRGSNPHTKPVEPDGERGYVPPKPAPKTPPPASTGKKGTKRK